MKNDLFLKALSGKNSHQKVPIWLMRQAGRYLPEYQALRKKYDFLTLVHTPELIYEVTRLPISIFDFDAAIVFSDILLIAECLGFDLRYEENGPHLFPPLDGPEDLHRLHHREVKGHFGFLHQAIWELKKTLTVPLIGFAGAPFTVASYLIEGGSSLALRKTKKWLLQDPASFSTLLDLLAEYTIDYLNIQIEAGCDAVQLFDSWAGVLTREQFQTFGVKYLRKICSGIKKCPTIIFCKGSSLFAPMLCQLPVQAISLDASCDLFEIRKLVGPNISLQGNLDPDVLLTNPQTVSREAKKIVSKMACDPGFIFNLGHGILPETPLENVEALLSAVRT